MHFSLKTAALAASLLPLVSAQVTTDCDPLKKECPADPAFATDQNFIFNSTPRAELWEKTAGQPTYDEKEGARFQITKQGESTTIQMKYYFFFGRTEIHLKASHGTGIVSSMMWISDCLDEVDWEFLGSKPTIGLSNYFGKGVQESAVGEEHPIANAVDGYHNYTTVWTKERLEWYYDGAKVRTVTPAETVINGTEYYPQTPMRLRLGIWAGGDPDLPKGTRDWAGGDTNYDEGPFYMYVKSAQITDYSTGSEYKYGDKTGDWESIEVVKGDSEAEEIIKTPPKQVEEEKSMKEKFNALSGTAKIAIIASVAGAVGLALIALAFYFFRQRRRGAREASLAAQRAEAERLEMEGYKARGIDPDAFAERGGTEYNPGAMGATHKTGFMSSNTAYSAIPDSPMEKPFPAQPQRSFSGNGGQGYGQQGGGYGGNNDYFGGR